MVVEIIEESGAFIRFYSGDIKLNTMPLSPYCLGRFFFCVDAVSSPFLAPSKLFRSCLILCRRYVYNFVSTFRVRDC